MRHIKQRLVDSIVKEVDALPEHEQPWAWQRMHFLKQFSPFIAEYLATSGQLRYANRGFVHGGFTEYSKQELYEAMSAEYLPKTWNIKVDDDQLQVVHSIVNQLSWWIYVKPDVWERSAWVRWYASGSELKQHIESWEFPLLWEAFSVQEECRGEQEFCINMLRDPRTREWEIYWVTERVKPHVMWDWVSSVHALVHSLALADKHTENILHRRHENKPDYLTYVPKSWERISLVKTASIEYGVKYLTRTLTTDQCQSLTKHLAACLDETESALHAKYLDVVRFDCTGTWSDKVFDPFVECIELNLAGWMPTTVYDELLCVREKYELLDDYFERLVYIARWYATQDSWRLLWNTIVGNSLAIGSLLKDSYISIRKKSR